MIKRNLFIGFVFCCFFSFSQTITQAEYFWDTDPGEGNGTVLLALDGNFDEAIESVFANNQTLPSIGNHTFNIRVKDYNNTWGPVFKTVIQFQQNVTTTGIYVSEAEYFWDTDPGEGSGTTLLALDGNFNEAIESVFANNQILPDTGNHIFHIRVRDHNNVWGPVFKTVIQFQQNVTTTGIYVSEAEYFWDTDPGEGNGTVLLALDGNFNEAIESVFASLLFTSTGNITFNIRVKDNNSNWGPLFKRVINIPFGTLGCMDSTAFNYNPLATLPDTSCAFIPVYGCMDSTAFNYNPNAVIDDSSCIPFIYGCIDSTMFNYNPLANTDDGSCVPFMYGCMDSTMFNYNASANTDDSSCILFIYGCTDSLFTNYNASANTDNGNCENFTYVPDNGFEQELINLGLDTGPLNDSVSTAAIDTVQSLYLGYMSIFDLTGIEDFTALNLLDIQFCNVSLLDLSFNTNLVSLYAPYNLISSNMDFSNNVLLEHVDLSGNYYLNSIVFDSSSVLTYLNINDNSFTSFNSSNLLDITYLDVSYNYLTSLDLSYNYNLESLIINDNNLDSLDVRNGNNLIITSFNSTNNQNLVCISVDDPIYCSASNVWQEDSWSSYSANCSLAGCMDPLACNYNPLAWKFR